MAYRGLLPEVPSFGQSLARNLGAGISQGISTAADFASKMALAKAERKNNADLYMTIKKGAQGQNKSSNANESQGFSQNFPESKFAELISTIDSTEKYMASKEGRAAQKLTPQDIDSLRKTVGKQLATQQQSQQTQQTNKNSTDIPESDALALMSKDPFDTLSKNAMDREKNQQTNDFKREQKSEDKLQEINDRLIESDRQVMRFGRLKELFEPEKEDQFPPAAMAAIFTKNGEMNPLALSQLSDDAQEALKLTYDQLTGAKETFGGRVTNFDAQTYLKRHPGLLNSPEGRRRVLRDLMILNDMTNLHDREILNIVEEYGGSGKISISKAEGIFRKRFTPQLNQMRDEFINPEKTEFNDLPNASRYKGREIIDPESKQKFRSDGKDWIPI